MRSEKAVLSARGRVVGSDADTHRHGQTLPQNCSRHSDHPDQDLRPAGPWAVWVAVLASVNASAFSGEADLFCGPRY